MKILTHAVNIYPYDLIKYKIIGIGGDPVSDPANNIFAYNIPNYYGGHRKSDIYFDSATQEVKEWNATEQLDNYRNLIKIDMEIKSTEYTHRLDYRIRYYNDVVARGSALTPTQQTDLENKQDDSITAKEYIHDRIVLIDAATTKAEIDIEYNDFIDKYNKKRQELENIL
jgi:hypothetical protein